MDGFGDAGTVSRTLPLRPDCEPCFLSDRSCLNKSIKSPELVAWIWSLHSLVFFRMRRVPADISPTHSLNPANNLYPGEPILRSGKTVHSIREKGRYYYSPGEPACFTWRLWFKPSCILGLYMPEFRPAWNRPFHTRSFNPPSHYVSRSRDVKF